MMKRMKKMNYKRKSNKKGYTIYLMMISLLIIVFWKMTSNSKELLNNIYIQKEEMKRSGITLAQEEFPAFEIK